MKKIFTLLLLLFLIVSLGACKVQPPEIQIEEIPIISGVEDVSIFVGESFDILEGISASDAEDGDITSSIVVSGVLDSNRIGIYTLTYSVVDSSSTLVQVVRTVTVKEVELVYPTGFFNYRDANTELKHALMATAEKYLLNNMHGGIPLYANGDFSLYSTRLQLLFDKSIYGVGFGEKYGFLTQDDSHVYMYDGKHGEVGEYTYRSHIYSNPSTFNQYKGDSMTDNTLMEMYLDSLYVYNINDEGNGFIFEPSMASSEPVPIDAVILDSGSIVSRTWQITLKDNLVWSYHPNTNLVGLPIGHEVINAHDFVDTYKLAIDEQWFGMISAFPFRIKDMSEYFDGEVSFDQVGIKVIDDLTFEFTFVGDMTKQNILYYLTSTAVSPINVDLYNKIGTDYGTSPDTIAYSGPYIIDEYMEDEVVKLVKNYNFHNSSNLQYTGYTFQVIKDLELVFPEFLAGKLEATSIPHKLVNDYINDPRLRSTIGNTVMRLNINGLGTLVAQQEQFPNSTYIPKPILANQDFKMAMFFAIDRQKLAEEVIGDVIPEMHYFTDSYLVDLEQGQSYRSTSYGMSVGEGLSPTTYGYDFDAAKTYYDLAIDALVEDGTYPVGTENNPTIITLEIILYEGLDESDEVGEYLKSTFEETFQNDEHHINVQVNIIKKSFPEIYYDHMMIGEFDLAIGGISGSIFYASNFLGVFCSDNRSGFALNWGIDTSIAEIEVIYYDNNNVRHREMWSFDAIASVLSREEYIIDGEEGKLPSVGNIELTPTTISFEIENYQEEYFTNLTYTIQYYDMEFHGYLDLVGYIDIPITSEEDVVITGLSPLFNDYPVTLAGEYIIFVNFDYVLEDEESGETSTSWFLMSSIITESTMISDDTSATISLVINEDDYERTLEDVLVLDYSDYSFFDATIVINGLDISITNLDINKEYQVIFIFDDGFRDYVIVSTKE